MALGDHPKVTRKRFTAAFENNTTHWPLRQTPMGKQWRLQWKRRRHPAFLKSRRVHPAYRRIYVYYHTFAESNFGRIVRIDYGNR